MASGSASQSHTSSAISTGVSRPSKHGREGLVVLVEVGLGLDEDAARHAVELVQAREGEARVRARMSASHSVIVTGTP